MRVPRNRAPWTGQRLSPSEATSLALTTAALVFLLSRSALAGADEASIGLGRDLYRQHCASCHGTKLEGQPNWRRRLPSGRLPAPPHDASGHTWHHSDAVLLRITKQGPAAIIGNSYKSDMPAYENVLTDEQIMSILNYIKSTWPPPIRERQERMNGVSQK